MATEQLETLGTEDAKWLGEYSQVHMNVFGTPLRVMDHGEGAHIWDVDGNEYLDFLAGIAVNALGYAHPKWVKAVSEQAAKAAHVSNYFATEPQIKLAAKLVKLAGAPEGSRVYFGNSGAEGSEAALKLAKLYGRTLPGASPEIGGKPARIISMTHGFHGRTMGALSATWKPAIREKFEPLVPNIEFVEAGNVEALHDAFAETGQGKYGKGPVAAVIMELIQGEAGVMPLGADYVKAARKLCDEHKALLIIDEVQTGIGRTGAWCDNPLFVSVRGRGLLDAIELAHPCSHAAMNWALEHGLIVNAVAPNALRLAPPLVITAQDVDQAVSILAKIPSDLPND